MNHNDPKTSELVDRLASIAAVCHDSTQLRERIAGEVFPVVDQMHDAIQALQAELDTALKDRVGLALRVEELEKQVFALTGEVANKADYAARMYRMHQEVSAELDALRANSFPTFEHWCKTNWNGSPSPNAWDAYDEARSKERDKLRAELDAIKAQEQKPIGYVDGNDAMRQMLWHKDTASFDLPVGTQIYAAPVAPAQPAQDVNSVLVEALKLAVRQNSHDMVMTGEELRKCESALSQAAQQKATS